VQGLGPATADEMVLAFLRAEIDSPRFRSSQGLLLRELLQQIGYDPNSLIDSGDIGCAQANAVRRDILRQWRGYGDDKLLFAGMPTDVAWRRARLQPDEIGRLQYCNHPTWVKLSGPSRLVADGAANIGKVEAQDNVCKHVAQLAIRVRLGERFPELILVQALGGGFIVLEGHTRATAYVLAPVRVPVEALIGSSPGIGQWAFHG